MPILLNFIEAITFYHQYQREVQADEDTGEVYINVAPEDVEHGFAYLKNVLFRRSDELSGAVRDFYEALKETIEKHELLKFRVNDIRQHIKLTPRSIQQYFKELAEYGYLQITGGKQRTGYEYELNPSLSKTQLEQEIETHTQRVMDHIRKQQAQAPKPKRVRKKAINANQRELSPLRIESPTGSGIGKNETLLQKVKDDKINGQVNAPEQGGAYTLKKLQEASQNTGKSEFTANETSIITGRTKRTENRNLKILYDSGRLQRSLSNGEYVYTVSIPLNAAV